eukprot:SAG31_NODE_16702_length_699_cov_0.936667_1_plen_163_part_10
MLLSWLSCALLPFFSGQVNPITHEPQNCAVNGTWDYTSQIGARSPQPALALVHGTADLTVPYIFARREVERAAASGIPHVLVTVPGGGHVPFEQLFASNRWMNQLFGFVAQTLKPACPHRPRQLEEDSSAAAISDVGSCPQIFNDTDLLGSGISNANIPNVTS